MSMKDKFYRFMQGRYGTDSFNKFLLGAAIVVILISMFWRRDWLTLLAFLLLAYSYFRMFSRNISRRAAENQIFLDKTAGVRRWFQKEKYMAEQRKVYHIYKCPSCGQKIRIPKGKGKIEICCPKCQGTFIKRS